MTDHRIANVHRFRGKVWLIQSATQQRARGHKDVLRLRARLHTQKQHRNTQIRRDSPHVLPPGSQVRQNVLETLVRGQGSENEQDHRTARTHPNVSPENFFAECDTKNTPATAANSIGNIYSLALKYHFATTTHILKPTNTQLSRKLRAKVASRQKNWPSARRHLPSTNLA